MEKGVQCNNKCPFCEQVEENEWHCFFFGCTAAKEVWQDTKACHMMSKYIENVIGFVAMIFNMLEEINKDNMAKIVMFLWALWWRRNQRCWHDKIPTIFYVIRRARDTLQDWKT
jgi:hypothetical protein